MQYDLGREFNMYPMGRPLGEQFRNDVLIPRLKDIKVSNSDEKLEISFEACRSFGSSFLEEAFGGLIRNRIFPRRFVLDHLKITADSPSKAFFVEMTMDYISTAKPN